MRKLNMTWSGVLLCVIAGFIIAGLVWLFFGIDVSGKPLEFQINCDVNNTECHVSSEDTGGDYYGLMAVNHAPNGDCFNYTISKGNCTIKSISDMSFAYPDGTIHYSELGDMQVKYSYEVICYSMGKLKLEELWK